MRSSTNQTSLRRFACAAVVLAGFAASSAGLAQSRAELGEALYLRSGLAVQIAALPGQFAAGVTQSRSQWDREDRLPEGYAEALTADIEAAFDVPAMRAAMVAHLTGALDEDQLGRVLAWLDSAPGQRITRIEEATAGLTMEGLAAYAATLAGAPPAAGYVQRITALAQAVKAVESTIETMLMMQVGVVAAMISATPEAPAGALESAITALEAIRPQLEQHARQQVMLTLLYTYREATEADLDAYIEFAGSPLGVIYHDAATAAVAMVLRDASLTIGQNVAASIRRLLQQRKT